MGTRTRENIVTRTGEATKEDKIAERNQKNRKNSECMKMTKVHKRDKVERKRR